MNKEINNKLTKQYLVDLKKPKIDKYERALIIKDYMNEYNLSIRAFALKFGFHKSTVEDWLLPLKVTKEKYLDLLRNNPKKDIYKYLRNNKLEGLNEINTLNEDLKILNEKAKTFINRIPNNKITKSTLDAIFDVEKTISYIKFRAEQRLK